MTEFPHTVLYRMRTVLSYKLEYSGSRRCRKQSKFPRVEETQALFRERESSWLSAKKNSNTHESKGKFIREMVMPIEREREPKRDSEGHRETETVTESKERR